MLAFSLFRRKKSLQSVSKHTVSSIFISRITKQPEIFKISAVSLYLAPWRGLEPPVYRLGVDPKCHQEVTSDAKKCLKIQGFSAFSIPSDTMLWQLIQRDFTTSNWLGISKPFDFWWALWVQVNATMYLLFMRNNRKSKSRPQSAPWDTSPSLVCII